MAKFIGRVANVGVAKEASRGTGVAPTLAIPKTNFNVEDKVTKARSEMDFGTIAGAGNQSLVTQKWAEGDLEGDILLKSFGLLLLNLFGSESVAGSAAAGYTHTYTLTESSQHQSLTLTLSDDIGTRQFPLAMINSLEIEANLEECVKYTVGFMSKNSMDYATYNPTYVADAKLLGRHTAVKIAATTGDLAAASEIAVKSLKLKIENNTMLDFKLGSIQPADILNQHIVISGELELNYEDRSYQALMLDGSYKALRITIANPDVTAGSSSGVPTFQIDLSRVDFEGWENDAPNDEIATQKITFYALYDITNANVINSAFVINGVSAY